MHHNARSLMSKGKMIEYEVFFKCINNPFGILIFTETWITSAKKDSCNIKGFSPIHLLRPCDQTFNFKERGGGISIFVREGIDFIHRGDLDLVLQYIECCFIETTFNNKKYLIAGMYHTPKTNTKHFIEKLNEILEPLKSSHEIIILGDFNINLFNDDSNKNMFEYCLQSNYLMPTILGATRVAEIKHQNGRITTSRTLIDNILIKANMKHISGVIETDLSDHFPIYTSLPEITLSAPNTPTTIQYRLADDSCKRKFKSVLTHTQFNICPDVEAKEVFSAFNEKFTEHYDKKFPIKTKTLNHKDIKSPWVTDTLLMKRDNRYKLCKAAKKKRISKEVYTSYRNKLNDEFRKAKAKYYENEFIKNSANILKNSVNNL